jgi:tetraacyldisaccharide 4'-kinase
MRGYGGDEVLVHRVLNPQVPVYPSPDRVAGVQMAADAGSDCVVLDDGFQHRAIRADENIVLIAAEDGVERPRLLPRGPWRESLTALRRASLAVVTRKFAPEAEGEHVAQRIVEVTGNLPVARAHLELKALARFDATTSSLAEEVPMKNFRCAMAVAGVAKPQIVWSQLEAAGVRLEHSKAFPDHHRYTAADAKQLNVAGRSGPLVTTLKDAVKLRPIVAPDVELYVPVQHVSWEAGQAEVEGIIERLQARQRADGSE